MKHTLITILCCLLAQTGKSQYVSFRNFTTDDGLSHNSAMSIYQDERGFVWFGTRDGANLYNGKEIKLYKHLKNNPNSLSYNEIKEITGDGKGTIYFLTNNQGISAYNIKKDRFTNIVPQKVTAIRFDTELFFAIGNRLYKYKKDNILLIYQLPSKEAIITNLHQSNDSIFIGTSNEGLYLLKNKRELSHLIPEGHVFDLFKDSSGDIWVSSYDGGGLYVLKEGKITNLRTSPNDPSSISSNQVHRCCEDQQGDIWIGTSDGLNKYDKRTKKFTRYYKKQEKNSLSESSIWGLMCDHQGTIWAGTYYGGVNFFNPSKQIYHEYHISPNESEGLSSPTIGEIIEDKHQNIWMCTEGAGVLKYNLSTKKFKAYKHDSTTNSISNNNAKTLCYDAANDILWIGTHLGGLNKLDIKSNTFTHYTHQKNDSSSLPSTIIASMVPLDNQLIVAAVNGIMIFNPQTGKCKPFFSNKEYRSRTLYCKDLAIDHQRVLWIANRSNGVSAYHFDTQKLDHYQYNPQASNGISSNNINSIYKDSQNRLWFCTNEHGLDLYRHETNDFENFDMQKNGLSSNVIYAVCELSKEQLLITTNNGFSILDYPNKRFTNYDKSKKIPLSSINENSLYKAGNGEVFIGGTDGMISFFPKDINHEPRSYNILPYRLTVNGQEINVGDSTHILSEDLTTTQEIVLSPQYTIFTLEYTSTDFLPIDKEEMKYKLEGFSDKWVNMRENNAITYTNLNPGTYVLRVKSTNEQNKLVRESSIKIVILPPFYQTGWAYFIYTLCASALIYLLLRTYNNRIKLQESLKYEKKQTEETEKMNQSKLRFFTNISHEFRTPLTIIIGQIEMLLQSQTVGSSLYNPILKIRKNCLQLQSLITELLDFRKLEQGYMSMKASEHNLTKDSYEHYLSFQEYAIQKQITYKFIKFSDEIQVWYDSKLLQKVMNNLISNAFKHTPPKGKITITVRKKNSEAVIEVTDNGEGIQSKDIDKIFDRFYQADSTQSTSDMSTGIGLSFAKGIIELHHGKLEVYSEPGVETTFSIHLQMGKEHFNAEEMDKSPQPDSQAALELSKQELAYLAPQEESVNRVPELKTKGNKILIVEDNESVRELLFNLFNPFYIVITACDGKEGLDKVKSEQPDLIVSDIVMPRLSGIELCKALKEDIETCHIPIVLLTAKTAIEHSIEGFKTGADDYITKPFSVELLLSRCNNLVNNRIMLQEKFSKQPQSTHKMLAHNTLDKEFIDSAIKVIENHIEDVDFNMDDFARETGIARTKLFTKLKAITGQTPAEFMLTIRLQKSAILLKNNPEFNISEIADRLGFSSPRYFRKCFKDKYHVTPQEYRREEGDGSMEEEEE